jgi:hypothetical protein
MAMNEEKDDVRKAALEFIISHTERKADGWTVAIVRGDGRVP